MSTQVLPSATLSGTAISLGTTQNGIVFAGTQIVGTGTLGIGVGANGNAQFALVHGAVHGDFLGLSFGTLASCGHAVHVGATGLASARLTGDGAAIRVLGEGASVSVAGSAAGAVGIVVGGTGTDATTVHVTGSVFGTARGISRMGTATTDIKLVNTGTIVGGQLAYDALIETARDIVRNRGIMSGDVQLGAGNDTYDGTGGEVEGTVWCGNGDDTVLPGLAAEVFDGGAGTDTLVFTRTGGVSLALDETFEATGAAAGDTYTGFERIRGAQTGADNLRGNSWVNVLWGNGGRDSLDGAEGNDTLIGGNGRDTLTGGAGNDRFHFERPGQGIDTITDFSNAAGDDDSFGILVAGFGGGLTAGALAASRFQARADNVAQDADDRFIFRTTDRTLWFDADGSGAAAPVQFAVIEGSATITAADFVLF